MSTDYQRESINKNPIPYQEDRYKDKVAKKPKNSMQGKLPDRSVPLGTLGVPFLVQAMHASIILLALVEKNLY